MATDHWRLSWYFPFGRRRNSLLDSQVDTLWYELHPLAGPEFRPHVVPPPGQIRNRLLRRAAGMVECTDNAAVGNHQSPR